MTVQNIKIAKEKRDRIAKLETLRDLWYLVAGILFSIACISFLLTLSCIPYLNITPVGVVFVAFTICAAIFALSAPLTWKTYRKAKETERHAKNVFDELLEYETEVKTIKVQKYEIETYNLDDTHRVICYYFNDAGEFRGMALNAKILPSDTDEMKLEYRILTRPVGRFHTGYYSGKLYIPK